MMYSQQLDQKWFQPSTGAGAFRTSSEREAIVDGVVVRFNDLFRVLYPSLITNCDCLHWQFQVDGVQFRLAFFLLRDPRCLGSC